MINNNTLRAISKRILNGDIDIDDGYYIINNGRGDTLYRLRRQKNLAVFPLIDIYEFIRQRSGDTPYAFGCEGHFVGHYVWADRSLSVVNMTKTLMK